MNYGICSYQSDLIVNLFLLHITWTLFNLESNATYIWCKNFEAPYDLDYQVLEESQEIPLPLLTEVSGAKKPILFCEGTKNSLDYQIYSKLFSEFCFVKPVQGHKQVIQYTKAYNKLEEHMVIKHTALLIMTGWMR